MIRSFLFEAFEYLPDVSLVCLDCDAVAILFDDAVQYSSTLLEVWVSPNHLLLDFLFS